MTKSVLAAIPIKPFGVAKRRLAGTLDAATRSRLGRAIAARTAAAATDAGALVAVVTGDAGVAGWARSYGYLTIEEIPDAGLNGAAEAVVMKATSLKRPWAIIHADLPLVTPGALLPVFEAAENDTVLVPSYDGGTNVVAGTRSSFRFSYGEASFHRHLASNPRSRVLLSPLLALDLDTADDLARARGLSKGKWLADHLR